jgi:flavin reductase (DIM6/NTAB) family NADH-FMN oxidoreductase RutF
MVDTNDFRQTLGNFATGVTVVTMHHDGEDHGMTVNSFTSVSLDPPWVLYNADENTRSHEFTQKASNYAVNILAEDQQWLSDRFAGPHEKMDDPFADVETTRKETGALVFENCLGYVDCEVVRSYEGGDHVIYVGDVQAQGTERPEALPLTYFRGEYGSIKLR